MAKFCNNCKHNSIPIQRYPCNVCGPERVRWEPCTTMHDFSQTSIICGVLAPKECIPSIKDVIFNPPATIIIWEDHTKTVVKCGENDIYDPEKGMAMAISRKALGDRGSYYNVFEKWLEPYYKKRLDKFVADILNDESTIGVGVVTVDFADAPEEVADDVCEDNSEEPSDDDLWCCDCRYATLDDHVSPCTDCVDFDQFEPDRRNE